MTSIAKYLRLLPAVVIVGTGLLVIKGADIARAAQAPTQDADEPDNSGLAPTDNGGAPAPRDFASDDTSSGSAAEVDVLSSLTRRRAELDARERALNMRENLLAAGEGRVDQKIGALKGLQAQMQALLAQRDDAQKAQIASLVKTYSAMKPKDAARIFNTLSDDVLLPVAKDMKSDVLAPVLAAMNPDAAQKLTVKLATLLKLPETAPGVCPDPAAPGTSADLAAPVPLQTAALSPPNANPVVTLTPPPPAPPPAATPPAAPPAQAATPPKPHTPPPAHHPAMARPTTPPPAKPAAASTTPPAKPAVAAATPPAKPTTAATPPATTSPSAPAAPPPAATPPAKPTQAANVPAPPAAAAPAPGG